MQFFNKAESAIPHAFGKGKGLSSYCCKNLNLIPELFSHPPFGSGAEKIPKAFMLITVGFCLINFFLWRFQLSESYAGFKFPGF